MKEKTEKAQCCGVAVDGGLDAAVGDDVERLVCGVSREGKRGRKEGVQG